MYTVIWHLIIVIISRLRRETEIPFHSSAIDLFSIIWQSRISFMMHWTGIEGSEFVLKIVYVNREKIVLTADRQKKTISFNLIGWIASSCVHCVINCFIIYRRAGAFSVCKTSVVELKQLLLLIFHGHRAKV